MNSTTRQRLRRSWGVDADPTNRPGVPMECTPPRPAPGVHWDVPAAQSAPPGVQVLVGALRRLTPVFGTGQPPRGLSGILRRRAYRLPEHRPGHWLLLRIADRLEVAGARLGDLVRPQPVRLGLLLAVLVGAATTAARYGYGHPPPRRRRQWPTLLRGGPALAHLASWLGRG